MHQPIRRTQLLLIWPHIEAFIKEQGGAALITILDVKGSAPRDAGTRMLVAPNGHFYGTIGGGRLEWETIKKAQSLLENNHDQCMHHVFPLGPQLAQCCGGSVSVLFECMTSERIKEAKKLASTERAGGFRTRAKITDRTVTRTVISFEDMPKTIWDGKSTFYETYGRDLTDLKLFGAGHTGKALMLALAPLPFQVTWYDEREDTLPSAVPANFECVVTSNLAASVKEASDGAFIVALTHSHDSDLEIMRAALHEDRFGYVGVIGSNTKAARFRSRLAKTGLHPEQISKMVCPIGYDGISSKEPSSVAISIVTELLMRKEDIYARQ